MSVVSRTLDLLASLGVLVLAAPWMLLTVLAIKLKDGWRAQVFCTRRRIGLDGRIFNAIKFRTMRPDAKPTGAQWAQVGHPRTTRIGAVIRECRIDELPQVFNVLRGEVSFVLKNDRTWRF